MELISCGGGSEVGRSCFIIRDRDRAVVLDAGIKLQPKRMQKRSLAPSDLKKYEEEIVAVLVSHAHLDHSGYVPALFKNHLDAKVHMTEPTLDIVQVLWKDHLKIEGNNHFTKKDIARTRKATAAHQYSQSFRVADGIIARFEDAGHVLGAATISLDFDGQRIFYTGDISNAITPFHDPVNIPESNSFDVMITETTNGNRFIPSRKEVFSDLTKALLRRYSQKSKVIIPAFALGRSQEIEVFLLQRFDDFLEKYPVYVDGMIATMNDIHEKYLDPHWISPRILSWLKEVGYFSPFKNEMITLIEDMPTKNKEKVRKRISQENHPSIIITTSGMMEGGPIHSYLRYMGQTPSNLLAIVGYQVEGTIGHDIQCGKKQFHIVTPWKEEYDLKIGMQIKKFDFSGHISSVGLEEFIRFAEPKRVIGIHGERAAQTHIRESMAQHNIKVEYLRENTPLILAN
ncbi:MAG: MBL fold metallo-hydrolase [Promethearchaeota archaeon]